MICEAVATKNVHKLEDMRIVNTTILSIIVFTFHQVKSYCDCTYLNY